jgi:hypothetical protein
VLDLGLESLLDRVGDPKEHQRVGYHDCYERDFQDNVGPLSMIIVVQAINQQVKRLYYKHLPDIAEKG